ncbi:hypothetical protein [Nocardioides baculatus]|uniref:Uncharacterized protein n=1 Tax=Nocardioides baculatus TaxID=2801337 RepID=A0ABS1L917_9ACTN|nr:hypothetical protein [Nocardioides baculatus]MBL0748184.1 hypothetical protein [Nocardioides baculatus]
MTSRPWVADPTVAWVIALTARVREPVTPERVRAGLAATGLDCAVEGSEPSPEASLLARATAPGPTALRAVVAGRDLALAAEHQHCDGLGLLALLGTTLPASPTSSARGVGDRPPSGGGTAAAVRRLREAALTPPATVAPGPPGAGDGDSFVRLTVPGRVPVAELVRASVAAVRAHNHDRGARTDRIAVAIGASRDGGAAPVVRDRSALLRLRDVERLSGDALREAIRSALPEAPPPGSGGGSRLVGAMATAAMGLLSGRLGSTLLVSHLGEVEADGVEDLAFYPVTGGGSGVSVGAVGLRGTTVVTLRARRHRHPPLTLEELGRRVLDELTSAPS